MPSFEMISNKVNKLSSKTLSLADIMLMSQEQLHEQFSHILNRDEIVNLYQIAQEKYNENRLFESQLLARINPQTSALRSLKVKPIAEKHSYIDMFPERSNYFVREGSVSSSFSPAAYLTELYREALPIHDKQSVYNLGNRRPDISNILLSQDNMDTETSTLTYANEILVSAISSIMVEPPDKIEEKLSSCRQGGDLPYHHAYNTVRLGIFQQDPHLKTITSLPIFNQLLTAQKLTALSLNLPPESFAILTENLTEDEEKINELYDKNFGEISESDLSSITQLSRYYQVSTDEIATLIELTRLSCGFTDTGVDGNYSALFLLYFNKMVRLFRATELTIQDMERIVLNTDLPIDKLTPDIIYQIAYAKIFVQQGYLTLSEAFILANAMIGIRSTSLQVSQFDLLFNTPLLDGKRYELDEQLITVHPDKLLQGDSFHRSVLKRSFNVDDAGLWLLHQMGCRNNSYAFNNTREKLSDLYRIVLLARAHALTIDELEIILQLSDYREVPLYDLDNDQLHEIIHYVSKITLWLAEQNWNVYQLFIMVGDITSAVWTPALDDLQQTLLNGIGAVPNLHGEALVTRMAPFFVSTLSLNSNYISELCLHWVNQIKPNGQTADKFWQLIQKQFLTDAERADVIAFIQTLTQLSIIINQIHLSEQELDLIIKKPSLLISSLSELGLTTEILLQLTQFHQWVNGSGEFSNDVLTALNHQQLSAEILASSLNDDVAKVGQALMLARQVGLRSNHNDDVSLPTQERTYLGHWEQVSIAIQLLYVSNLLNITPDGIVQLLELSYEPKKGYFSWTVQSHLIQGALNQPDNETVYHQLEEQWGNALSTFYRLKAAPVPLPTRDDVYYYLLIDNQVSGSVTTSRIAETIASLQLYIYRALNDLEDKTESGVISRPFFINWDKYNARYSTWAGGAQLLYYPENYLDPTMRIGQTQMMDGMLQDISQSNLSPDTIETAFNSYLSQFEHIANLNIVSGYHNNINFDNGLTYLIGHSADSSGFYWRSVDQGQFNEDGKFPASAWSEWKAIQMGINAVQDWVRPFIFNSRLHVAWVEKEKQTDSDNQPIEHYILKISKLNYNGTWAAVNSFSLDSTLRIFSKDKLYQVGFYCSLYSKRVDGLDQDTIYILFYTKKEFYTEEMPTTASGLFIYPNMTTQNISSQDSKNIVLKVYNDFDTLKNQHLIKKIAQDNYLYNKFQYTYIYAKYGYDNLTMVNGSGLSNINVVESGNRGITLSLDANLSISYRGEGTRQREQCNMMKKYYNNEPSEFVIYPQQTLAGKPLYNVVHIVKTEGMYNQSILLNNPSAADFYAYNLGNRGGSGPIPPSEEYYRLPSLKESTTPIRQMVVSDSANNKSRTDGYYDINTALPPQNVYVHIFSGNTKKSFLASNYVEKLPNFSLEEMIYNFTHLEIDISFSEFINNKLTVTVDYNAYPIDMRSLGTRIYKIEIQRQNPNIEVISFNKTNLYAQYMQRDMHRVRINTLFAQQLITKANKGIDHILTMDTQYLPEPQMGNGDYIRVTIPKYDTGLHGNSRAAKLLIGSESASMAVFWQGRLNDIDTNIVLFVPLSRKASPFNDIIDFPSNTELTLQLHFQSQSGLSSIGVLAASVENNRLYLSNYTPNSHQSVQVELLKNYIEPMDFTGANSLYFWEMFYYLPAMVCSRLLQENQFDQALTWLKYIWSPMGYQTWQGNKAPYSWNCRPLEESISWSASTIDTTDPDVIAQNDPIHYKITTFMKMLDLLIARGDTAYRQLERDMLNEAKMWYTHALSLLGEKPYIPNIGDKWGDINLGAAAEQQRIKNYHDDLIHIHQSGVLRRPSERVEQLMPCFYPQVNTKLEGYWDLLELRLYNLRHNLSIDGQPLHLPLYAEPLSPEVLKSSSIISSHGGRALPKVQLPLQRFSVALGNARGLVSQLMQFGNMLQGIIERQDSEAMAEMMQLQASDLSQVSIALQESTIAEIEADKKVLQANRQGALQRFNSYTRLYDENVNVGEQLAMDLFLSSSITALSCEALRMSAAIMNMIPNIYGLAVGGGESGAIFNALAIGTEMSSHATRISAERLSYNETYRRRRQEWGIHKDNAQNELEQIDAQLDLLGIRQESAKLQKRYLEMQRGHTQAQLEFIQRKFSNKAMYNWLRGCLSSIYYQFYDLTLSRCLMAQEAFRWETNQRDATFIKPGAWNSNYAGLLAGENLALNLTQLDEAYLKQESRPMEVTRTISLAQWYSSQPDGNGFILADEVKNILIKEEGGVGTRENGLILEHNGILMSTFKLADFNIKNDYPDNLGNIRRIKQISVSLPMLMGAYQDIQAVLNYSSSLIVPRGCNTIALSHGINDSGQFQLNFDDPQFLPFEGIPIDDSGIFTLSFPNATGKQKLLLLSLSNIILHIHYGIRQ